MRKILTKPITNLHQQPETIRRMSEFFQARNSNLDFYKTIPLYYKKGDNSYLLYKPMGIRLSELRINQNRLPDKLFIRRDDKQKAIREVQKLFNEKLKADLKSKDHQKIKITLATIVNETFLEPRSGSLEGLSSTLNILVNEITDSSTILRNLVQLSFKNYTTVLHSINVMVLSLCYGSCENYQKRDLMTLGLSALLHDVGKLNMPSSILDSTQKLNDDEFDKVKLHPQSGYNILQKCNFSNKEIEKTALFHHERINGVGYPFCLKRIPEYSQIIGLIDCYEALTNDDRPYRDAVPPYEALSLIKDEVLDGKFSKIIFRKFIFSLNGDYNL